MAEAARWDRASMVGDDWTVALTVEGAGGTALNVTGTWTLQLLSGPGGNVVETFTPNTTGAASGQVSFTLGAATTAGLAAKRYAWACWWTPSAGAPTQTILGGWWAAVARGTGAGSPGGDAATIQIGSDAVTILAIAGPAGPPGATTLAGLTDVDLSGVTPVDGTALLLAFDEAEAKWKAGTSLPGSALLGAVVGNWLYAGTQYDWLTVTDLDFAGGAGSNNFSVGSKIGLFGPGVTGTGNVNVSVGGLRSLTTGRANVSLGPSLVSLQTGNDNFGAGGALGAMILGDNAVGIGPGTLESFNPSEADLAEDLTYMWAANDTQLTAVGAGAGGPYAMTRASVFLGDGAGNNPYTMGTGGTRKTFRSVFVGANNGMTSEMDADDLVAVGWQAFLGGTGATATGSASVADGAYASVYGYATHATGDGSAALFTDSTGQGATSDTADLAVIGTALHTVRVPGTLQLVSPGGTVYDIEVSDAGVLSAVAA